MKVIILCGGMGTRLKEETEYKPKPMVYVGNKPILWHIMKMYSHFGFNEFILALGYKGNYIKDYFLNEKAYSSDFKLKTRTFKKHFYLDSREEVDNFDITFVDTGLDALVSDRILRCQKYIPKDDKNYMITYGDGVSNVNLKKVFEFHQKQNTLATIVGVHAKVKYGVLETSGNKVDELTEKPISEAWLNGGFMILRREATNYFKLGEMEHQGLNRLATAGQLSFYKHHDFWYSMDTYKDYEALNKLWNNGVNAPWKIWK